jgi:poly(3-hydroxybutyrate) depolymerase
MFPFTPLEPYDVNFLYSMVESTRFQLSPIRNGIKATLDWMENEMNPLYENEFSNNFKAALEITERITRTYKKPSFGIKSVTIDGEIIKIKKSVALHKPFCNLLHFEKINYKKQPKLLIVAPLAGHHATLLRSTVQDTLPYFDVYITDWKDASQVPLSDGNFDMNDNIDYVINFIEHIGSHTHVMAVCQPTVPVLAAVSIMSADKNPKVPASMILMGGPIDARKNPTSVNIFATGKSLDWFKNSVITRVPINYPGYMRPVYPGFLQLAGFIGMNLERHINSHYELYRNFVEDEDEKAQTQMKFYDEYLSVMDLPAEFYLQTIKEVFQDFSLATGKLVSRDRRVDLSAITKTALLGIEGERDDIAAVGQTKAALKLCDGIPESKKHYYMQKGVGHYGVFSGTKFREHIVKEIKKFAYKYDK